MAGERNPFNPPKGKIKVVIGGVLQPKIAEMLEQERTRLFRPLINWCTEGRKPIASSKTKYLKKIGKRQ
ncbi:MAG: hypothetical protein OXR68_00640 [Alphaproteobacteria bacterium]|nr:hypothetical protein [Alphaproteobacteria bacterium]MDD9919118.1 hypothetical protein [Alphaproteobacteria bacterium]